MNLQKKVNDFISCLEIEILGYFRRLDRVSDHLIKISLLFNLKDTS